MNDKLFTLKSTAYRIAQAAISDLKSAIYEVLTNSPKEGLSNAQIGRTLGIYTGHVRHEGHISRTLLSIMEAEGVVEQSEDKKWKLKKHFANAKVEKA